MTTDPVGFDLIALLRERGRKTAAEKPAFSASPGMEQAILAQAQQGGGDPAAGGAPPGMPPGGAPPGMPPGGDPAAGGAPPGAPPGPPPGGAVDGGPAAPMLDPAIDALIQQKIQAAMAQGGQAPGGAPGADGKPNTTNLKIEPHQFTSVQNDLRDVKTALTLVVDSLGLQMPASSLFNRHGHGQGNSTPAPGGAPPAGGAAPPPGGPQMGGGDIPAIPPMPGQTKPASSVVAAILAAGTPVRPTAEDREYTQPNRVRSVLSAIGKRGKS